MINRVVIVIGLIILSSCKLDEDKQVDREKFKFKTGDDTELFFRNMRASDYDREVNSRTNWEIYRHEDLYGQGDSVDLRVAIIINIMDDAAYLYLEPGENLPRNPLVVYTSDSPQIDSLVLENPDRERMLEYSSRVYEAIKDRKKFFIIKEQKDTIPILEKSDEREAFRKTVSDYYRLTRVF